MQGQRVVLVEEAWTGGSGATTFATGGFYWFDPERHSMQKILAASNKSSDSMFDPEWMEWFCHSIHDLILTLDGMGVPYQLPKSLLAGLLAGAACGFVNASVALMGAPLGIYVLLRGWEPNEARGNMSVVFAVTTIFTVATQLMSGMYTMDLLKLSVIGMAGACCGNLIGVRVGRIFDRQRLTKIILVFLTIFAFSLFMRGIK